MGTTTPALDSPPSKHAPFILSSAINDFNEGTSPCHSTIYSPLKMARVVNTVPLSRIILVGGALPAR